MLWFVLVTGFLFGMPGTAMALGADIEARSASR